MADGDKMNQIQAGTLIFSKVPSNATDVQFFPIMPNGLISAGKLVAIGHTIILDDPEAIVINKNSK